MIYDFIKTIFVITSFIIMLISFPLIAVMELITSSDFKDWKRNIIGFYKSVLCEIPYLKEDE